MILIMIKMILRIWFEVKKQKIYFSCLCTNHYSLSVGGSKTELAFYQFKKKKCRYS